MLAQADYVSSDKQLSTVTDPPQINILCILGMFYFETVLIVWY